MRSSLPVHIPTLWLVIIDSFVEDRTDMSQDSLTASVYCLNGLVVRIGRLKPTQPLTRLFHPFSVPLSPVLDLGANEVDAVNMYPITQVEPLVFKRVLSVV